MRFRCLPDYLIIFISSDFDKATDSELDTFEPTSEKSSSIDAGRFNSKSGVFGLVFFPTCASESSFDIAGIVPN